MVLSLTKLQKNMSTFYWRLKKTRSSPENTRNRGAKVTVLRDRCRQISLFSTSTLGGFRSKSHCGDFTFDLFDAGCGVGVWALGFGKMRVCWEGKILFEKVIVIIIYYYFFIYFFLSFFLSFFLYFFLSFFLSFFIYLFIYLFVFLNHFSFDFFHCFSMYRFSRCL